MTIKTKKQAFKLQSPFKPQGDQVQAIKKIYTQFKNKTKYQTLLGVTGSGKTFTVANVISKLNQPALVLAPNKTLAAQLFIEFKDLFPSNAIEYFVSYYDYYQPEAYLPSSNTYIEKDASINEQIDLMRHSATRSLLEREDVIVISSISCIYGIGQASQYENMAVYVEKNQNISRDQLLKQLISIHYKRNDFDFHRGVFRCRGDIVEIFPSYEDNIAIRLEFFGDYIDCIKRFDSLTGQVHKEILISKIYPASHHVSSKQKVQQAIKSIREELRRHLLLLEKQKKYDEKARLKQRTLYDMELLTEMGTCPGIENYSRHLTGRASGQAPPTLLEYFPKQFLTFIDESHITIPQAGGMYRGDRSRKETLVQHGFRLPSALDNRPLNFQEFENNMNQVLFVSATPGDYEINTSSHITEQILRPTGLTDPQIVIQNSKNQIDHLLGELKKRIKKKERVLITTLTKKMAEKLCSYYQNLNIKTKYLHSDIKTLERTEILGELRSGVIDVLIGINLLREGLDLPEVSLVAVLDADREGFLRSDKSLIQIMGRAARHINGQVILYADQVTKSMKRAIDETDRRRDIQIAHNKKHNIKVRSIKKVLQKNLSEIYGLNDSLSIQSQNLPKEKINKQIKKLTKEMKEYASNMQFEQAAKLRDHIKALQIKELE